MVQTTPLAYRLLLCSSCLLLSACNMMYMEQQVEELTPEMQEKFGGVVDQVKDGTNEALQMGGEALDTSKDIMDSAGDEAVKPLNSGKRTDTHVKTKEQMLEDAGGQMIDDMRGSPMDVLE